MTRRERREGSRTIVDHDAYRAAIVPPTAEERARIRALLEELAAAEAEIVEVVEATAHGWDA